MKNNTSLQHFEFRPVAYDSKWPQNYVEVSNQIKSIMDDDLSAIHHIGSTAIPGLLAKPIIDILGEARNIQDISRYQRAMKAIGFESKGEFGIADRAYFSRKSGIAVHLHIFPVGHFQVEKHLLFRDYLLAHPDAVKIYQNKKEELLEDLSKPRDFYQVGKNELINSITTDAYTWKGSSLPQE